MWKNLSGIDMSDVRVHYNSAKPAEVGALAYTQGTDIHVAPGQEKHLPHEAWHVVQQAQGRVRPTLQLKDTEINEDEGLEREANVLGERANEYIKIKTNKNRNEYNSNLLNQSFQYKTINNDYLTHISGNNSRMPMVQLYQEHLIDDSGDLKGVMEGIRENDGTFTHENLKHNYAFDLNDQNNWAHSVDNAHAEISVLGNSDSRKKLQIISELEPCISCTESLIRAENFRKSRLREEETEESGEEMEETENLIEVEYFLPFYQRDQHGHFRRSSSGNLKKVMGLKDKLETFYNADLPEPTVVDDTDDDTEKEVVPTKKKRV